VAINNQTIEVNIDELVLHGFSPLERYQIATDLQIELTRLFTGKGLPASFNKGMRIDRLHAGSFQSGNGNKTISTGSQIAGSVYDSFSTEKNKALK